MPSTCLYKYGLDYAETEEANLLSEPTRFIVFEIIHGSDPDGMEEHEILSIKHVPEDLEDQQELEEAVEDYYDFYFTNDEEILERAMLRLFNYGD